MLLPHSSGSLRYSRTPTPPAYKVLKSPTDGKLASKIVVLFLIYSYILNHTMCYLNYIWVFIKKNNVGAHLKTDLSQLIVLYYKYNGGYITNGLDGIIFKNTTNQSRWIVSQNTLTRICLVEILSFTQVLSLQHFSGSTDALGFAFKFNPSDWDRISPGGKFELNVFYGVWTFLYNLVLTVNC